MKIITVFFKKIQSFLFKFLQTRVIVLIITNCAVLLIVELSDIVKDTIKNMNQAFLIQLYTIEGWLFEKVHNGFTFFEEILNTFKEKVESALNVLLPDEFTIILNLIQFGAWLDLCVQSLVSNTKNSIGIVVSQTVAPFLILTGEAIETITTLTTAFTTIEQGINQTTTQWYEFIKNELTLAKTTYNGHINNFINAVYAGFAWYNEGVNAIEIAATDEKTIIEGHNQTAQGIIDDILVLVEQCQGSGDGANQTIESISELLNGISPVSTTPLDIDYNQYRLSLLAPDVFEFNPTMPDWQIDLAPARSCLIALETRINDLNDNLTSLPQTLSDDFINQFPQVFQSELIGEIRPLIVLAMTQLFIQKKNALMTHISGVKTDLMTYQNDIQLKIMEKANEIIGNIEKVELNLVEKVPELLTPTIERYVEKVATAIEKAKEEISHEDVNIMDFIPDLEKIEQIMATFEEIDRFSHQKPGKVSPLKHKFIIQDVYRLLCNNFFRVERMAILFALAPGDLQVETSDIVNLLLELQE
ncbi:hypothetical protein SAMN02746065_107154 [Desulfocicer vacuolatum DSM 3385]|uniref:Uncharacterized protein n=1 Tax=Desulfocicer vacuolatum DSM 3385 TaxID=1121400 RepID=A0A1W2B985_9BACT|nr:hypothetical protein [Desulfocicer vacuolatum]SMC69496.1 hypothetical protein SAMN02746065_107154 [Desulfocicer vacuolatum DSM 3385]